MAMIPWGIGKLMAAERARTTGLPKPLNDYFESEPRVPLSA
jgi:hypothetical protein